MGRPNVILNTCSPSIPIHSTKTLDTKLRCKRLCTVITGGPSYGHR